MKNESKYEILISTIYTRLNRAEALAEKTFCDTGIRSLIVCQTFEDSNIKESDKCVEAFRVVFSREKGLSRSRQLALEYSDADYVWFLDDDVSIFGINCVEAFDLMSKNDIDILTTAYSAGGVARKKYKERMFHHSKMSIMSVSSIEIFCRREFVSLNDVKFDFRFGLGAQFPSGEENIFLMECLKKNGVVKFAPIVTSEHSEISSGYNFVDENMIVSKGALMRRLFGHTGCIVILLFFLKKLYKSDISLKQFFPMVFKAYSGYFRLSNSLT